MAYYLHWVQTFNDKNLRGLDELRRIQETRNMIVNRLINRNPILESLNLFIHEIKVVGSRVKCSDTLLFPSSSIQWVIVIQAYHSGSVTDECVGVWVTPLWWLCSPTKDTGQPPHEGTFPTSWVCCQTYHNCLWITCWCCACYHIWAGCVAASLASFLATRIENYLFLVKSQLGFWCGGDWTCGIERWGGVDCANCHSLRLSTQKRNSQGALREQELWLNWLLVTLVGVLSISSSSNSRHEISLASCPLEFIRRIWNTNKRVKGFWWKQKAVLVLEDGKENVGLVMGADVSFCLWVYVTTPGFGQIWR